MCGCTPARAYVCGRKDGGKSNICKMRNDIAATARGTIHGRERDARLFVYNSRHCELNCTSARSFACGKDRAVHIYISRFSVVDSSFS